MIIKRKTIFFSEVSTLGKIPAIATKNSIKDKIENDNVLPLHGLHLFTLLLIIITPPIYVNYTVCYAR